MSVFGTYISALGSCYRNKWVIGVLYLILLIFALSIASPFQTYLEQSFAHSLELERSIKAFDFTIIKDFLKQHKYSMRMFMIHAKWILALYFIMSIFISSAIVHFVFSDSKTQAFSDFIKGGTRYFWKFLRLSIYFILFYLIVFLLFFKIFEFSIGGLSVFQIENDFKMVNVFYILLSIFGLMLFYCLLIQDMCKLDIAKNPDGWIWNNLSRSLKLFWKQIWKFTGFYIIVLISFIFLSLIFYILKDFALKSQWLLLSFLFGQIYIIFRIALKLINLFGLDILIKNQKISND